jgi:hypothetical protein
MSPEVSYAYADLGITVGDEGPPGRDLMREDVPVRGS